MTVYGDVSLDDQGAALDLLEARLGDGGDS